jgi:alpha-1,2-mannosyltransferase
MQPPAGFGLSPDARIDDLYGKWSVAMLGFAVVVLMAYLCTLSPPLDVQGYALGRDFVNMWIGGRAAQAGDPAALFDFATHNLKLKDAFGPDFPPHNWSYPPHTFLFLLPLGRLPYAAALGAWTALGLVAYLTASLGGDWRRGRVLFALAAPAAAINLVTGQNGFFTTALFVGGLRLLQRRPVLAGVLFGCLTIKPQLGLLLPIMLVSEGRWRTVLAATGTALALAGLTTAMFGAAIWSDYAAKVAPVQAWVMAEGKGIFTVMMPTPFMNARIAGLDAGMAYAVQGVASAMGLAAMLWTFVRRRDPLISALVLATATFLVSPYAFDYDMGLFTALLLGLAGKAGTSPALLRMGLAVWMLPLACVVLGLFKLPVAAPTLAVFLWMLLRELRLAEVAPIAGPRYSEPRPEGGLPSGSAPTCVSDSI